MSGRGEEEQISISVKDNSITFTKNQDLATNNLPPALTFSNPPSPSASPSRLSRNAFRGSKNLIPERSRKLSKSSEDLVSKSPKKLENVFVPFAKITKSIQNLSSSVGQSEATAANYQYVSFEETEKRSGGGGSGQVSQPDDIESKIVKTGTKALIMII